MKKVLVTGSLGYIGSVLTGYLANKGYSVVGYDTCFFRDSILYAPPDTLGRSPTGEAETILKDARDLSQEDLNGIDAVVHLAGISNDPMHKMDEERIYGPTRDYALKIADLCKEKKIKFIFASSCSVYGIGTGLSDENSLPNPQTGYSLNKYQIEEGLKKLADKNFSPVALRFATVFGASPRLRFDVIVNMFAGMAVTSGAIVLNSDGSPWRPNVHILDVCGAIARAVEYESKSGELLILNVGDDAGNLQVLEIAKTVASAVPGCKVKFLTENPELDKEGLIADRKVKGGIDNRTYKVSFEKIKKTFPGFACRMSVEDGARELAEIFKKLPLTYELFKKKDFYRLQKLEYLLNEGYISEDLYWLKERPAASLREAK